MSPNHPDHIADTATGLQVHVCSDGSAQLGITAGGRRYDVTLPAHLTSELTDRLVYDTAHVRTTPQLRAA